MKKIIAILVILMIIFSAIKLLKERKEALENISFPVIPTLSISLVKAKEGSVTKKENYLALLASQNESKISTKLSGYIKNISITESQKVKKGDLLLSIDSGELLTSLSALNATLKQQESDYTLTKKIYDRNQKLLKAGALPKEKLEELELGLQAKKTQIISTKEKIKQLAIQQEYLEIKAPYDGIVGDILKREGDLATPGQPIVTLSLSKQKMTFSFVSQKSNIQISQSVLKDGKIVGEIKTIYTQAKNGLSVAQVDLLEPLNLPDGAFVSIDVLTDSYRGCEVPSDTLLHQHNKTQIMLYGEDKFIPLDIKVLYEDSQKAIITPCPKWSIAQGSETKLSKLHFYGKVKIRGSVDE